MKNIMKLDPPLKMIITNQSTKPSTKMCMGMMDINR